MKQKLMLCLLLAGGFYLTTNAQIKKGKWIGGLSLNGKNYKSEGIFQGNFASEYRDNHFSSSLIVSKMLTNKFMLGAGLNYNRNLYRSFSLQQPASSSNQTITQTFGFMLQTGFFKEIVKNIYLSQILQYGYNDFKSQGTINYNYPNENTSTQRGYELFANCKPLQCSYLFKNKFMFSLNLVNVNYQFVKKDPTTNSPGNIYIWDYSLNPFQNGITFSYIFK